MYNPSQFLAFTLFGVFYLLSIISLSDTQLLINVKNQGGDVVQETIISNVSENAVTLEFQRSDGTLITQLLDFRNEVQILKALVLGEEERGQSQYQVMCFVCHFNKDDFISSDAMSKLRQKNPGTIRTPEEDKGRENLTMSHFIDLHRSDVISSHISPLCAEAKDATYTREVDIQKWANLPGSSLSSLLSAVRHFPSTNSLLDDPKRCFDTANIWSPCSCHLEMCIGWYPCGLKYCKGKSTDKSSSNTSYRCGIKTCKKCSLFSYYVRQKQLCLWDE